MRKTWVIMMVPILATVLGCQNVKNKVDVSVVENDIRAHLPIGSSKADVIAFLDQRKIAHGPLQKAETSPDGKTVIPNSHTEIAIIRDVRRDGFIFKTTISIQIEFRFDDTDSKLLEYTVHEIYKGL